MEFMLTTVHVRDLAESVEFYQNILDLTEVKRVKPRPGVEIVFLKDEGGIIELIAGEEVENGTVSLGFKVENIEATVAELRAEESERLEVPIETPNGTKLAFFSEPNGVEIELIEGLVL